MTDPRTELRNLIAAAMRPHVPPPAVGHAADAVIDLFHAVRREDWQLGTITVANAGLVAWTRPTDQLRERVASAAGVKDGDSDRLAGTGPETAPSATHSGEQTPPVPQTPPALHRPKETP
jgi:hypothetical protein